VQRQQALAAWPRRAWLGGQLAQAVVEPGDADPQPGQALLQQRLAGQLRGFAALQALGQRAQLALLLGKLGAQLRRRRRS
jgi:hypothetical protein